MGGIVGKEYAPLRDMTEWAGLDPAKWIPVMLMMASAWANEGKK